MLKASGKDLYYHTIIKPDGKGYYDIDFLLSDGSKVSPIEVKSSGYKAHTSLDKFSEKYSSRIAHKYLVYTKDLKKDGDTLCVPIYMVPLLPYTTKSKAAVYASETCGLRHENHRFTMRKPQVNSLKGNCHDLIKDSISRRRYSLIS